GAAARAGLHRGFEHGAAPALADDGHDEGERVVRHLHDLLGPAFQRIRTPSAITDITGASAISATRPSPCTSGSWPSIADDAPSASASRKLLASGPVATPPAS